MKKKMRIDRTRSSRRRGFVSSEVAIDTRYFGLPRLTGGWADYLQVQHSDYEAEKSPNQWIGTTGITYRPHNFQATAKGY